MLAGYLAGRSYQRVEQLAGRASLLLVAVLVLVGGVVLGARWVARHPDRVRALAERQLDRPWVTRLRARCQRQLGFLVERLRPGGALALALTLTASVVALVGADWAFSAVLQDVLAGDEGVLLDGPVQRFLVAHREAWLTPLMRGATDLGNAAVLLGLVVLAGLVVASAQLAAARAARRRLPGRLGAVEHHQGPHHRARPPATQAIGHWTGYAFPSGHTTKATATYGLLAARRPAGRHHPAGAARSRCGPPPCSSLAWSACPGCTWAPAG